jgi:hypothetical protein
MEKVMSDEPKVTEAVARAIAAELGRQDDGDPFLLPDDLTLTWLDQGEVDFGKVARAAIDAMRAEDPELVALRAENERLAGWLWEACGGFRPTPEAFAAVVADLHDRTKDDPANFSTLAAFKARVQALGRPITGEREENYLTRGADELAAEILAARPITGEAGEGQAR